MPRKTPVSSRKAPSQPGKGKAQTYDHPEASLLQRPEVGAQPRFKKSKPPARYRYDSSLAPALDWDGRNPARETAEALIRELADLGMQLADLAGEPPTDAKGVKQREAKVEALRANVRDAESRLRRISGPFLNWTGKAERLSFEVPTLPLFVHEKLSTQGIIETLKGHKSDRQFDLLSSLYGESAPLADQVLRAYEYSENWRNRMILGDSLVVMNSLLRFENMAGQVQMIYLDPPYGVKFGSNFQPFVRKRDVGHNDDDDLTREPEMVQAYRDTWELGLHSYLTYLRDRLLLARELLSPSGSIFVQISDENLHHVRELMDEVFGPENFVVTIVVKKKGATTPTDPVNDFLLWFGKKKDSLKPRINRLFERRREPEDDPKFNTLISPNGLMKRAIDLGEGDADGLLKEGWRWARVNYPIVSQHFSAERSKPYKYKGQLFSCGTNAQWRFEVPAGLDRLAAAGRLHDGGGKSLGGVMFWDDWPYVAISNVWNDLKGEEDPAYVVQTAWKVVQRCLLMTTEPGDLVLDPTCGSGTTAYVAESWGRRWITMDTSRVPLALARQRLLTATFDYYELADPSRGPAGGFVYKRKQNRRGEEIGGIVPRVTLKSIANNETPKEEVLVDRPEKIPGVTRICGPFVVEATMPTAQGLDDPPPKPAEQSDQQRSHVDRMIDVLRRSPVLRLPKNQTVTLKSIRPPAKSLALSAEAVIENGEAKPGAILFGPESGPISERFVREAWDEAGLKHYTHLYVIGFAIEPKAREFIEKCGSIGLPATYLAATMDLQMGDLLKNMRSSQIFSVCGLPDVAVKKLKKDEWQVELLGLNTFDPITMQADDLKGSDVPAWLLDTDYNGLVFNVRQAFFPRTGAWENLKKALKADYEESVWDHLAGTVSAPFVEGDHGQVAVKVIDPRGNELIVVRKLEAGK